MSFLTESLNRPLDGTNKSKVSTWIPILLVFLLSLNLFVAVYNLLENSRKDEENIQFVVNFLMERESGCRVEVGELLAKKRKLSNEFSKRRIDKEELSLEDIESLNLELQQFNTRMDEIQERMSVCEIIIARDWIDIARMVDENDGINFPLPAIEIMKAWHIRQKGGDNRKKTET